MWREYIHSLMPYKYLTSYSESLKDGKENKHVWLIEFIEALAS